MRAISSLRSLRSGLLWWLLLCLLLAPSANTQDAHVTVRLGNIPGAEDFYRHQVEPLPFGTKGEKPALAFLSGEWQPPAGEKLQPVLKQLALQRTLTPQAASADQVPAVYALILLQGRMSSSLQQWLQEQGVQLLGFYPYSAYRARIPVHTLESIAAHPLVRWVGQPHPVQKVHPALYPFLGGDPSQVSSVIISLFGHDEAARNAIAAQVQRAGLYDRSLAVLFVEADARTINRLLDMDAVLSVEPAPVVKALHSQSQTSINADWLWRLGWDGRPESGRPVKVAVLDTGLRVTHLDFANLTGGIAGYNETDEGVWWEDWHGHGTHVTGTLLGEGNARSEMRGTAAGIRYTGVDGGDLTVFKVFRSEGWGLWEWSFNAFDKMMSAPSSARRHLFNMSGGSEARYAVGTDAPSRKVDELFAANILPVFAAGNSGQQGDYTVNVPAVAKGAVAVGALYDTWLEVVDRVTWYSSRGPSGDGRLKPDLVAPGSWIDSCAHWSDDGYNGGWSGTSMAAPHVAGLAATLLARYDMSAWAAKAALIANAVDLGQPAHHQGHGKVDGMELHSPSDGGWFVVEGENTATGSVSEFSLFLPVPASLLKVVLVYPDPPASPNAATALVNDLDLFVDAEPLEPFWGDWVSISGTDNTEVVSVYNAPAGEYRIRVFTYAQNQGESQRWAVCVRTVYGSLVPTLFNEIVYLPYAVKPWQTFSAIGLAGTSSYVSSGVFGWISSENVFVENTWMERFAPWGSEWVPFPYTNGVNQGNIQSNQLRFIGWDLWSPYEGVHSITYSVWSINSLPSSATGTVIVDGTPPMYTGLRMLPAPGGNFACQVQVQDTLAGIDTASALYRVSTDNGATWGDWTTFVSIEGHWGSTAPVTLTTRSLPVASRFLLEVTVADTAGNDVSSFLSVSRGVGGHLAALDAAGYQGQTIVLRAFLQDAQGNPLPGRSLQFLLANRLIGTATTDSEGRAALEYTIPDDYPPGTHDLTVRFNGESGIPPAYVKARFTVWERKTTTVWALDSQTIPGGWAVLFAFLHVPDTQEVLAKRPLHYYIDGQYVGSVWTDGDGWALFWYEVPSDMAPGEHLIEVVYEGEVAYRPSRGVAILRIEPPLARLVGRVSLQDYVGDVTRVPLVVQIRESGKTEPLETYEVALDSDSLFLLQVTPQDGRDIALLSSHWLRQVIVGVDLKGEVWLSFELVNGDVDGDNEVSLNDFAQTVAAFGATPGDGHWNANADLDGDEEVTLNDLGIVLRNFGMQGDE